MLSALSGLTKLSLEDDHLLQAQTALFLSSLQSLRRLQHLEISRTALRDDEMQALAVSLSGLTELQTLRLFRSTCSPKIFFNMPEQPESTTCAQLHVLRESCGPSGVARG